MISQLIRDFTYHSIGTARFMMELPVWWYIVTVPIRSYFEQNISNVHEISYVVDLLTSIKVDGVVLLCACFGIINVD